MYNKSFYEVEYPDGTTNQPTDKIIAENMISQVESKGHYYQVLPGVTVNKRDGNITTKVNSFIKSSNRYLQHKQKPMYGTYWYNGSTVQLIGFL